MEILIIGAGDVGSNIARDLSESHSLTVIDRDSERIDALTAESDVTGVVGDGRSLERLREANIESVDVVVASTDDDATNVMVCNAARHTGDAHTIARVKQVGLFRAWQASDEGFGVDTMLCVDLLAARSLVRTITLPGAQAVDLFADDSAEVAEFRVAEDAPIADSSVAEADRYPSVTFAAIVREDDIRIPNGETVIRPGDSLVVIGSPTGVSRFAADISDRPAPTPDDEILVVGGDTLGYQIAQLLEDRELSARIVEHDSERAAQLMSRLQRSTVVESDATDMEEFGPDDLSNADFVIGAVDDDTNYLVAQLAHEFGTAQTAAVVDDPAVVEIFEQSALDVIVHPEDIVAGEILERVYRQRAKGVSVVEHDNAEVLEIVVDQDSLLAGDSLVDVAQHLPSDFVVGAIIRGGTLRTPRGGTIIQTGDRVIAFVDAEDAADVAEKI